MTNFWNFALHGLSAVGLALSLASWSYYDWAHQRRNGIASSPHSVRLMWVGLVLLSAGQAATDDSLLTRGAWVLLALLALLQFAFRQPSAVRPASSPVSASDSDPFA